MRTRLKKIDSIVSIFFNLQVVDPDGNLFSVDVGGSSHVMLARGEGEEEAAVSGTVRKPQRYQQHAPRFFVIHPDGNASEFLRYQVRAAEILRNLLPEFF